MRVLKIQKLQPFNKMTLIAKFKDLKLSSYSRSLYITWYSEQCGITALIKTIYDNIVRYLDSFLYGMCKDIYFLTLTSILQAELQLTIKTFF